MGDTVEIILEIGENHVKCRKNVLIENSHYFKIMFSGNFVERNQTTVKLQDVDFKSLNIILSLLEDDSFIFDEEEDLLLVLQTSCMLQFDKIRAMCIEKVTEIMSVKNCLKIWLIAESLDLRTLYLKAKNLSLMEFPCIKDSDFLYDLNLKQLHTYLANIFLNTKSEFDVFTTCMIWFYGNCTKESFKFGSSNVLELFYYFLTFLDIRSLSLNEIKEIRLLRDISNNDGIVKILNDVFDGKVGCDISDRENFSKVNILLNNRKRIKNNFPCILIDAAHKECLKRAADTMILTEKCAKNVLLYDSTNSTFKRLLTIPDAKHEHLIGFHILGYKEFIFLFGGEFLLGKGNWSDSFWVYDTTRDRWERKTKMPYGRRHFESCMAGDVVYIIGGTGNFRVLQDNMFSYNYKLDEWSKLITLPCIGRQVKCCEYKNQLFLLNGNNKCGYLFDSTTSDWIKLEISDTDGLVRNFPEKFVVFSHEDFIYIKGSSIIKLKIIDNKLEVISANFLRSISFDEIESVLCNDVLYTMYKRTSDDSVVLEKSYISCCIDQVILECDAEDEGKPPDVELCGRIYALNQDTKLFSWSHYSMIEQDTYLTDFTL